MTVVYKFSEECELMRISTRMLINYASWCGQRQLDMEHIANIRTNIGGDPTVLNMDYKLVKIRDPETDEIDCYVIDGQHRREVIRQYLESETCEHFDVLATVYDYTDKTFDDVEQLFRIINSAKPFVFGTDSMVFELNSIAGAVMMHFNKGNKVERMRHVRTRAPYMCISVVLEWLRMLAKRDDKLPSDRVVLDALLAANEEALSSIRRSDDSTHRRCVELGFALTMTNIEDWTRHYDALVSGEEE